MQQPEQKKEKADASASIDKKDAATKMVSDLKTKLEQMPEGQVPEGLMEQVKTMEEKMNSGEMVSPDVLDKMTEEAENAFFQAGEKINQAGVSHAMKQGKRGDGSTFSGKRKTRRIGALQRCFSHFGRWRKIGQTRNERLKRGIQFGIFL